MSLKSFRSLTISFILVITALCLLLAPRQVFAAGQAKDGVAIGIVDIEFEPDELTMNVGQSVVHSRQKLLLNET